MKFFAHTQDGKNNQLLKDHLYNTGNLASNFSIEKFKNSAKICGLLHDLGKYQISFQRKLNGENIQIDHAVCGAKEIKSLFDGNDLFIILAYPIIGHHSGLPNFGNKYDNFDKSSFCERINKVTENYSIYKDEIVDIPLNEAKNEICLFLKSKCSEKNFKIHIEFLIRYLYSCLTDADFLDTEKYCTGKERKKIEVDWLKCKYLIDNKISLFKPITSLQKSRIIIQNQANHNIKNDSKAYLLDMPTGSGKTLCSMNLALYRAIKEKKKRIIYVIPYTSIIEQTANVFKNLFPQLEILEHHSNCDYNEELDENLNKNFSINEDFLNIKRKQTENWDVPVIITTNVQFFESIYSNRSSKLRKFHNMADSILIFDEIHTLPPKYFIPCMNAIYELTENYNSEALFLTATMPDFKNLIEKYVKNDLMIYDLIPDKSMYSNFEKCTYKYIGECNIISKFTKKSILVIVNKKSTAKRLFNEYEGGKKFCLTTHLTSIDRVNKLEEIRKCLDNGENIVVFSTSLIEAGVDVDFDIVFREINGLDSIIQASGRCNREGKKNKNESVTYIFETKEKMSGEMFIKASICKNIIQKYGIENISKKESIFEYFNTLYQNKDWTMIRKDEEINLKFNFVDIDDDFKLIESTTASVIVPSLEIQEEISKIDFGFPNRRKLSKYSFNVTFYELKNLIEKGIVREKNGFYILEIEDNYSNDVGLIIDEEIDDYIF